jgi:hypothetical protein
METENQSFELAEHAAPRPPKIPLTEEEEALVEAAAAAYPHVDRYLLEMFCCHYLKHPEDFEK